MDFGMHDRTAGGKIVGRGAGRGGKDKSVAAVGIDQVSVLADTQINKAGIG